LQHFQVTAADFASLNPSLAFLPRNVDYSLQTHAFLRLAAGSQLIDRERTSACHIAAAPRTSARSSRAPAAVQHVAV